jgi:hypothetical protein
MTVPMFRFLPLWLGAILRLFRSRQDLLVENLALRQQLSIFERRNPRPTLAVLDKLFWALACRFWSDWKKLLLVVAPETVVRWHRAGIRLYWSMISKSCKSPMSFAHHKFVAAGPVSRIRRACAANRQVI